MGADCKLVEKPAVVNNGPLARITTQTVAIRDSGGGGVSGVACLGLSADTADDVGVVLTAAAVETRTLEDKDLVQQAIVNAFEAGSWNPNWCLVYEVESYANPESSVAAQNRRVVLTTHTQDVELNAGVPIPAGPVPVSLTLATYRSTSGMGALDEAMDPGRPMTVRCWRIHDRYVRTLVILERRKIELEPPVGQPVRLAVTRRRRTGGAKGTPAAEVVAELTGADLTSEWELLERLRGLQTGALFAIGIAGAVAKRLRNTTKPPTTTV